MLTLTVAGRVPSVLDGRRAERIAREAGKTLRGRAVGKSAEAGVRFVSLKEMTRLNESYRKRPGPTDVLSFGAPSGQGRGSVRWHSGGAMPSDLGDVIVCAAYARQEAASRGVPYEEEIVRLIVHGILHLVGFDHERVKEERTMFGIQEKIVSRVMER